MSPDTLFEPAPDAVSDPWVAVLDEANVLEWLSSLLLTPKAAFVKHYPDVLDVRDDLVPLVRGSAAGTLVGETSSGPSHGCVLVEVEDSVAVPSDDPRVALLAPSTSDCVRAIHMRSEPQRVDFLARQYANVDLAAAPIEVSPELFVGEGPGMEALGLRLGRIPRIRPAIDHALSDRLGGGRLMAICAVPDDKRTIERVQTVLRMPQARPSRRRARTVDDWLVIAPALLRPTSRKTATFDQQLFEDTAATLLAHDRHDVLDPDATLAAVDERMRARETLSSPERQRWETARTWIAGLLSGARPFTRFRSAEFRTEKALLLALVRSEPTDVLTWRHEEIGAHTDDLLVAAIFAGLAHGRKSTPLSMRPRVLDAALARRELFDLHPTDRPASEGPRVSVATVEGDRFLVLDDTQVHMLARHMSRASERLAALDLSTPASQEGLAAACRVLGWEDLVHTTIRFDGGFSVETRSGEAEIEGLGFPLVVHRVDSAAFEDRLGSDVVKDDVAERLLDLLDPRRAGQDGRPG